MFDKSFVIYDKQTLENDLKSVMENLQNILNRITVNKIQRNTSTTNIENNTDLPQTFEKMDLEIIYGLVDELCRITEKLRKETSD